jgi:hypothetical protein
MSRSPATPAIPRDPGDIYTRLIAWLDEHHVASRLIDHAPEGRTEIVSAMRQTGISPPCGVGVCF